MAGMQMNSGESGYCPLCGRKEAIRLFYTDASRSYYRCSRCQLVFVPPMFYLSPEAERAEYDKHRNSPEDSGYRTFLSRLFLPMHERLPSSCSGLDYGCGPGPTLSQMFAEAGHQMNLYDPFYAPSPHVLNSQYDFITASEVVEHFHNPAGEFVHLWSLLKKGGWLGLMTKLALDQAAFANWHYKNDLTHVCFFSRATMEWLAEQLRAKIVLIGADVILLQKVT